MRKFAVVTTFNQKGLDLYGQNFLDSFCQNMPLEVDLYVYAEGCSPKILNQDNRKVEIVKVEDRLVKLLNFKKKYKDDPKAVGNQDFAEKFINQKSFFSKLKKLVIFKKKKNFTDGYSFVWDAVRFSHKVYATIDAARTANCDVLIWMDADNVVHSKVPISFLNEFIPENVFSCYLGRKKLYTETGWYSLNLKYPNADKFIDEFELMYEDANNGIFKLPAWTDCHAYDEVRKRFEKKYKFINKNISQDFAADVDHPLVYSDLGQYFDHLKGGGKEVGISELVCVNGYKQLKNIIKKIKPWNILEIGANRGNRAIQMCNTVYKSRRFSKKKTIYYLGFDLFEDRNSGHFADDLSLGSSYSLAHVQKNIDQSLDYVAKGAFNTELVKGDTNQTLKFLQRDYGFLFTNFAFIDGSKYVETIKNDGEATSYIKHRVFNNYYVKDSRGRIKDISKVGCNQYIDSLDRKVFKVKFFSKADFLSGGGLSKMVYVKRKK
jgi:hypothetical protein